MDKEAMLTAIRDLVDNLGLTVDDLFLQAPQKVGSKHIDIMLPRKRWIPAFNTEYWSIARDGEVTSDFWSDDRFCGRLLSLGNVFETQVLAEECVANLMAWTELQERSDYRGGHPVTDSSGAYVVPGVGFSTTGLRNLAVSHIGQSRIDSLVKMVWK